MIEQSERTGTEFKVTVANNGYILRAYETNSVFQSFSELIAMTAYKLGICEIGERDKLENVLREFIIKSEKNGRF